MNDKLLIMDLLDKLRDWRSLSAGQVSMIIEQICAWNARQVAV